MPWRSASKRQVLAEEDVWAEPACAGSETAIDLDSPSLYLVIYSDSAFDVTSCTRVAHASCRAPEMASDGRGARSNPEEPTMADGIYERGLATRRAVLGEAHVDRQLASADDFSKPFQDLVTTYCWGEVWGREELPRKTRSMLNLAMLTALNRPQEFKLHVRGALTNGVSPTEIREVLMQTAIYCGVPAAVDAFRNAREVFSELDKS